MNIPEIKLKVIREKGADPSGDTTPSKEDFDLTKKIKKAGVLLGIPLIDHIVISYCDSYSFQAHQQI